MCGGIWATPSDCVNRTRQGFLMVSDVHSSSQLKTLPATIYTKLNVVINVYCAFLWTYRSMSYCEVTDRWGTVPRVDA
jgi:hypothetical protein